MFEWVRLRKAAQQSGYTEEALRIKIRRGKLGPEKVAWKKAPDGNLLINVQYFNDWLQQ